MMEKKRAAMLLEKKRVDAMERQYQQWIANLNAGASSTSTSFSSSQNTGSGKYKPLKPIAIPLTPKYKPLKAIAIPLTPKSSDKKSGDDSNVVSVSGNTQLSTEDMKKWKSYEKSLENYRKFFHENIEYF